MTVVAELRQRLKTLVEELPEESLLSAETLLIALNAGLITTLKPTQSQGDRLIAIIQRRLPSEERDRLILLRQRLADASITAAEHEELLSFVDRVEQMDAERAEAMIQLAQLRNVGLNVIVQEFLPKPQLSHAI